MTKNIYLNISNFFFLIVEFLSKLPQSCFQMSGSESTRPARLQPVLPWTHTSLLHLLLRLPSLDFCSPSGRSAPGRFYSGWRWTATGERDVSLLRNFPSWMSDGYVKPEQLLGVQEFSIKTQSRDTRAAAGNTSSDDALVLVSANLLVLNPSDGRRTDAWQKQRACLSL